ncbi:hypothetical protein GCM10009854_35460 [Saccharopolyspora halophila]|uniref:Uncharacterized protein n=1 Tax=Saccharopolyspora halophila TaxID=405551 RepID=A0ABP5TLZ6_9PSEU
MAGAQRPSAEVRVALRGDADGAGEAKPHRDLRLGARLAVLVDQHRCLGCVAEARPTAALRRRSARVFGDAAINRSLDRVRLAPGCYFAEQNAGINGWDWCWRTGLSRSRAASSTSARDCAATPPPPGAGSLGAASSAVSTSRPVGVRLRAAVGAVPSPRATRRR